MKVSIKDGLLSESWEGWDFVTFQQVSGKSINYETFQPYLNELSLYVKTFSPKAKQFIHQTWAYEEGSELLTERMKYSSQREMFNDLEASYKKAAEGICADGIIPSGETLQNLIKEGLPVHRDTFHASLGVGRYALGLLWYAVLCGKDVSDVSLSDFDEPVTDAEISIVKRCVSEIVNK